MKHGLLLIFLLLLPPHVWTSISGQVNIYSETPFSNLDASSGEAECTLSDNRTVSVTVPVSSFIFSRAMMQEHFN
ncbi:MAG: hypothetical protein INR69_21205, partial [Mucilaginibacter polytrichastri]|nr:hypothetical protein [Mucilaginibacter polytrichastri]